MLCQGLPAVPGTRLLGCAVADYDNDGRPDIFVSGYGRTILYHNEGNGTFRDVTKGSGLEARGPSDWTTSAAWADVDGDGRLDLYVCRYVEFNPAVEQLCSFQTLDGSTIKMACGPNAYKPQRGSLYHNEGGGHFKDITAPAGLENTHGDGLGCVFCDFNNDGRPDLFIANDRVLSDLYLNIGGGRFRNVGVEMGTAYNADGQAMAGMGLSAGDYDNDGRFDLLVATFQNEPKSLFHNDPPNPTGNRNPTPTSPKSRFHIDDDLVFSQQSYPSGLGAATLPYVTFGATFIDTENSGVLDIVLVNGHVLSEVDKVDSSTSYPQPTLLFRNRGGGKFGDASAEAGPDFARLTGSVVSCIRWTTATPTMPVKKSVINTAVVRACTGDVVRSRLLVSGSRGTTLGLGASVGQPAGRADGRVIGPVVRIVRFEPFGLQWDGHAQPESAVRLEAGARPARPARRPGRTDCGYRCRRPRPARCRRHRRRRR